MRREVVLLAVIGACIGEAPIDLRPCPCVEGWKCCPLVDRCIEQTRICAAPSADQPLLPLRPGLVWVYRVKTGSRDEIKTQTAGEVEPVPPPPDGA